MKLNFLIAFAAIATLSAGCSDTGDPLGQCANLAGEWEIQAHCAGGEVGNTVTLTQTGCAVGVVEWGDWSGTAGPGTVSLTGTMGLAGNSTCAGVASASTITLSCTPACDVTLGRESTAGDTSSDTSSDTSGDTADVAAETLNPVDTATGDTPVDSTPDVTGPDTAPDTFTPDTFTADTFTADTFTPDTLTADTFTPDVGQDTTQSSGIDYCFEVLGCANEACAGLTGTAQQTCFQGALGNECGLSDSTENNNFGAFLQCGQGCQQTLQTEALACLRDTCGTQETACLSGGTYGTGTCAALDACLQSCFQSSAGSDCNRACYAAASQASITASIAIQYCATIECNATPTQACLNATLQTGGACEALGQACLNN